MDISFSENEIRVLRELGVAAAVLFGSRAQGLARKKSDYDIGVLLKDTNSFSPQKRKEIYDAVYEIISPKIGQLVNIDIVFLDGAPGELQAHVMKHGRTIFEANSGVFENFRERVITSYSDFEYLRNIFHQGILSRVA